MYVPWWDLHVEVLRQMPRGWLPEQWPLRSAVVREAAEERIRVMVVSFIVLLLGILEYGLVMEWPLLYLCRKEIFFLAGWGLEIYRKLEGGIDKYKEKGFGCTENENEVTAGAKVGQI
jgi:hypothetical protein